MFADVRNNSVSGGCSSADWRQGSEKESFAAKLKKHGYKTMYAGKYLNQVANEISKDLLAPCSMVAQVAAEWATCRRAGTGGPDWSATLGETASTGWSIQCFPGIITTPCLSMARRRDMATTTPGTTSLMLSGQ